MFNGSSRKFFVMIINWEWKMENKHSVIQQCCGSLFKRLKLFSLVILVTAFCQPVGYASQLSVGAMDFPPFYVFGNGGQVTGINVDIVTAVLDKIGETYEVRGYPVKRLYSNIVKGSCNVFYGIKVPDKVLPSDAVLYSQNKISKIDLRVYSIGDTPVIQKKEDLVGKSIIVLRGYGYGGFIKFLTSPKTKIKVQTTDKQDFAFKMLKKKRADYLLAFKRPAEISIKHLKSTGYSLPDLKVGPSLFLADGYFIVSQKTPEAKQLLARMENAYEELLKGGAFSGMIVE